MIRKFQEVIFLKKSVTISVFPRDWDLKKVFETAKKVGLDGVELNFGPGCVLTPDTTDSEYEEIKRLASEAGIQLKSIASGFSWTCSPTADEKETRDTAHELIRQQIISAHKLGAESILVVPGFCGVDFVPDSPVVDYMDAYNRALDWMNDLKGLAEELNVDIAIENVWNKFLLSPLDFKNIIDQVNSPKVGCYFDVGNVLVNSYPEQWIRILGSRIKKVHFKDFDRSIGTIEGFVDLLKGNVDYRAVMKAFKEVGYDGWATAEFGLPEGADPVEYAQSISDAMTEIFSYVE